MVRYAMWCHSQSTFSQGESCPHLSSEELNPIFTLLVYVIFPKNSAREHNSIQDYTSHQEVI